MGGAGGLSSSDKKLLNAWEGFLGLPQLVWNLFFAFLVVLGQVGQNVTLPIWFASVPKGESLDPLFILSFAGLCFCLIFGMFTLIDIKRGETSWEECRFFSQKRYLKRYALIGMCNAFNGILLVFAAARCAPFLQAILGTFNILWTIIARFFILGKYPTKGQTLFAAGVFFGLFLSSVPEVFGLDQSGAFKTDGNGIWKIMWPVIFAVSFIPSAIMNVVGESVLKDNNEADDSNDMISFDDDFQLDDDHYDNIMNINQKTKPSYLNSTSKSQTSDGILMINETPGGDLNPSVNVWYYLCLQSIFQELTFVCFFWVDAIPTFGTANGWHDIFHRLAQGWRWFFGMNGASPNCTIRALVFVGCYTLSYIGTSLLLRYTEGATWASIVSAIVTPGGGIFWLLFTLDGEEGRHFHWKPDFDSSSWYILVGLFYMSPFIYLYDREAQRAQMAKEMKDQLSYEHPSQDEDDRISDVMQQVSLQAAH